MWHPRQCWSRQLSLPFTDSPQFELKGPELLNNLRALSFLDRSVMMVAVLRVWGTASLILVLSLWLCSQRISSPVEARRAPFFDPARTTLSLGSPVDALELPELNGPFLSGFREAPAFRNGNHCAPSRNASDSNFVCDAGAVHIAMTLDATYLRGSMAAIFSILKHSACPENVIFHFMVSDRNSELEALVRLTFPSLRFQVYHFSDDLVKTRISSSIRSALEQPLNYARNYLAHLLEDCIERVIYLDSDLVVVDDIAKLWNTSLGQYAVGAPEYCHANFTKYFTPTFWENDDLASTFRGRKPCYFNTGVMVIDLAKWRAEDYTSRIESWMHIQKEKRIYELGSLPPFLLVFAGSMQPIEHRWNQHGLGGDNMGRCRNLHPGPVSLLHWSGMGKPWNRLDDRMPCPIDSLWAPYDLFL